jgi:hypothetical protein
MIIFHRHNYASLKKLLIFTSLVLFSMVTSNIAMAQLRADIPAEKKAMSTVGLSSPLIHSISEKGIYNITIKSGESSLFSGLNFEIVFLNASSPILNATPAKAETNVTSTDTLTTTGLTIPSVIEHVLPVKSFDMRIASIDGKDLATKINEIPRGGRILENVNLNNYTGNITINLDNIVPDQSINDIIKKQMKAPLNQSDVRDSVKIEAKVRNS